MRDANYSFKGSVGAPLVAALLHLCTMHDVKSSLDSSIGASPVRATLCPCAMRDTNSFLLSCITFHIHAMHDDANSIDLPGLVW